MARYEVGVDFTGDDDSLSDAAGAVAGRIDHLGRRLSEGGRAGDAFDRQMKRLERTIGNLTTPVGILATAVGRVGGLLGGMVSGAVIGAVSALTDRIVEQALGWERSKRALDEYKASLEQLRVSEANAISTMGALSLAGVDTETGRAALEGQAKGLTEQIIKIQDDLAVKERAAQQQRAAILEGGLKGIVATVRGAIDPIEESVFSLQNRLDALVAQRNEILKSLATTTGVEVSATKEQAEQQRLILAKSTFEIEYGKIESASAAKRLADAEKARQQEALGYQIQAQGHAAYLESLTVARSTFEIEYQRIVSEGEAVRLQLAEYGRQAELAGGMQLAELLIGFAQTRSKKLFLLAQVASVAMALVKAHEAAALALATPPGPPATAGLAAKVLKWGYINAAAAGAIRIATGGGGGGGGGAPPTGLGGSGTGTTAAGVGSGGGGPRTIRLIIEGAPPVWSRADQDYFMANQKESLIKAMNDTGGMGTVVLQ